MRYPDPSRQVPSGPPPSWSPGRRAAPWDGLGLSGMRSHDLLRRVVVPLSTGAISSPVVGMSRWTARRPPSSQWAGL